MIGDSCLAESLQDILGYPSAARSRLLICPCLGKTHSGASDRPRVSGESGAHGTGWPRFSRDQPALYSRRTRSALKSGGCTSNPVTQCGYMKGDVAPFWSCADKFSCMAVICLINYQGVAYVYATVVQGTSRACFEASLMHIPGDVRNPAADLCTTSPP